MNDHTNGLERFPLDLSKGKTFSRSSILSSTRDILEKAKSNQGIFIVKTGSTWLKEAAGKPDPKPLYFGLWHQGEVCILYAETNAGKSILGVSISHDISLREPVIYFDFELSEKQFQARYSDDYRNLYDFPPNFLRAELNPDEADYQAAGYSSLEEYIITSMELALLQHQAKVLVIDNLTYLSAETEKAKDALPLMKEIKKLKSKHGLSILLLAHTPKRNHSLPITKNDLQGSKMLINFCDSAFAIGESQQGKHVRYIKQIKCRNAAIQWDAQNVGVFEVKKVLNFLSFLPVQNLDNVHSVHTTNEHEHLKPYERESKDIKTERVIELRSQGLVQRAIAEQLQISLGSVNKIIKDSVHVQSE